MGLRKNQRFKVDLTEGRKRGLLQWAAQYRFAVWLDGNAHRDVYESFDALMAVCNGPENIGSLEVLYKKCERTDDWLFGYLTYDLKNELEALSSNNFDGLGFAALQFFVPEKVICFKKGTAELHYLEPHAHEMEHDISQIVNFQGKGQPEPASKIGIKMRIHKDTYRKKIRRLLNHIHRGDVYEANFCQEFYAEHTKIDPIQTYLKLNAISSAPFAAFMKMDEKYLLCASPERYLKKQGQKIISQPIKGTAPRSGNQATDKKIAAALQSNIKERAENIMITDLVRNDLSRIAKKGSVKVEELCKVHPYKQVHQMISTVSCEVYEKINPVEIIKNTFPMGSMTGAPKVSAMQLIEDLEETKRGLYSGAVGYFTPNGDFDFNVVIRSILYNARKQYVSYSVGSAITARSDIEKEYQECLLKAKAMRSVLGG